MATKMLESSAVSAFCESVAVMHSAGIQMDEAVFLLGENMEDAAFKRACDDVYKELIVGKPLALAMDDSGCFPSHVVDMAGAGEHAALCLRADPFFVALPREDPRNGRFREVELAGYVLE